MGVETVVAIITAGIAFITSVLSITYNFIQSSKNRVQKVILENRIKYMHEIREGFSKFISLANVAAINAVKASPELKKEYFNSLFAGYGKIKTYIKPFYEIDKELLDAMDRTYFKILGVFNGESENAAELDALREDFADKYLKYDWAYWKYIQRQKEGVYVNSDDAFDKVYYEFIKGLENKE